MNDQQCVPGVYKAAAMSGESPTVGAPTKGRHSPSTPLLAGYNSRRWWRSSSTTAWCSAVDHSDVDRISRGRLVRVTPSRSPPPRKASTPAGATASTAGPRDGAVTTSARLMRRSASFDTIAGFYLAGRWPCSDPSTIMASLINGPIVLALDKSTQTPSEWADHDANDILKRRTLQSHRRHPSLNGCLSFTTDGAAVRPCKGKDGVFNGLAASIRRSPGPPVSSCGSQSITIPSVNRRHPIFPCHGSVEGFNQEIERLVRNTSATDSGENIKVATPDGHREPIANQLLRVRSVNTQTPCGGGAGGSASQTVIGRRRRCDDVIAGSSPPFVTSSATTVLPVVPFDDDGDDDSDDDIASSGEKIFSSPLFVYFLETTNCRRRPPPDGCEQLVEVKTAAMEHWRGIFSDYDHLCKSSPAPAPVTTSKCHIPSERSAFCPPLLNRYVGHRRTPLGGSTLSSVTLHNASPVEAQ